MAESNDKGRVEHAVLSTAMERFASVVGKDWVFGAEKTSSYNDPYPLTNNPEEHKPAGAVAPASVDEVQGIVAIANELGIPLWPVSRGNNFAYGGSAPVMAGTVVLDMSRMNRIIEVNEEFGYALVEPGVSYFDLYDYIQSKGLKLWLDVPDPGWGSVMGNALDHGIGYTPYGDHFAMQCGMEVVLPTGEIIRTGMGSLEGNNTWQLFKYGFGPYVDGMFSQSNFGIVTKMGIWLMPEPAGYRPYMISFEKEEDIEQVVEILRPLKVGSIIQNAATIRSLLIDAAVHEPKSRYYDGKGPTPKSIYKKIMEDQHMGMWNFCGALYGPPPVTDTLWSVIRDSFAQVPGAKFYFPEDRTREYDILLHRAETMKGIPKLTEFNFLNWNGGGGHVGFSPVSPLTGKDAIGQYRFVDELVRSYGFDYMAVMAVGWRELHHVVIIVYDKNSPDEIKRMDELFNILVDKAAEEGYGEYRTHVRYMDRIAATYNWNNGSLWRMHERLKDALDPNGIIAPGKSGIWPKRYRG
jgi:4-cresol dehydrogenase (hydroxylating)